MVKIHFYFKQCFDITKLRIFHWQCCVKVGGMCLTNGQKLWAKVFFSQKTAKNITVASVSSSSLVKKRRHKKNCTLQSPTQPYHDSGNWAAEAIRLSETKSIYQQTQGWLWTFQMSCEKQTEYCGSSLIYKHSGHFGSFGFVTSYTEQGWIWMKSHYNKRGRKTIKHTAAGGRVCRENVIPPQILKSTIITRGRHLTLCSITAMPATLWVILRLKYSWC